MKKRICALALAALLLTGCGKKPTKPIEQTQSTADYTGVRMLQPGDENGLYCFNREDAPGWLQLCYIDYATRQAVTLCAQPNCTHDSEACTACMPVGPRTKEVQTYADNVWVLDENTILMRYHKTATQDGTEVSEKWLDVADRNGANRRTVWHDAVPDGKLDFDFEGVADEQALYGWVREEKEDSWFRKKGLYRVPLDGGEPELWIPEVGDIDRPLGVIDGKLIVRQEINPYMISEGEEDPNEKYPITDDMTIEEMNEAMHKRDEMYQEIAAAKSTDRKIYAVDLNTRQCTDVFNFDIDVENYSFIVEDDRIWWIADNGTVGWVALDGTTGTLPLQWPEGLEQAYAGNTDEEKPDIQLEWVTDNKMIFTVSQPIVDLPLLGRGCPGQYRYSIDLESGFVTMLPQNFVWDGVTYPGFLWAETPEGFLVNYTVEHVKQMSQYAGDPTENDGYSPRLGLISYEDFFAGKNAWEEIQIDCDLGVNQAFLDRNT